jgi:hypothetical protein
MAANVIGVFLSLMPTHNASQYIPICAVPVVNSSRVSFDLSNVFPLLGPSMRVSRVDVSDLTLSYLLMPGQSGKTLTLAYAVLHFSSSQHRSSERIRNTELQLHYLSWKSIVEEWNLLRWPCRRLLFVYHPYSRFMSFHIAHVSNFRLCKMVPSSWLSRFLSIIVALGRSL